MDADETIVLKKYSQVGSLKNISQAYEQSLSKVTGAMVCVAAVSYTHLDVYKRQVYVWPDSGCKCAQ